MSESKGTSRIQQLLWVVAGVVVVSLLVAAASWLFSPSGGKTDAGDRKGVISEGTVKNESFRPESAAAKKSVNASPVEEDQTPEAKPSTREPPRAKTAAPKSTSKKSVAKHPSSPVVAAPKAKAAAVGYAVQMGAFGSKSNAEALKRRLKDHGFSTIVLERGRKFKVLIPGFKTRAEANAARSRLDSTGFHGAFVVLQE